MEWINVNSKLPDTEGKYLVSCYSGIVIAEYRFGKFSRTYNYRNYYQVTHWMKLPSAPMEKEATVGTKHVEGTLSRNSFILNL